ncbi:MAG: PDZ domain-containing protein [Candidatus Zixiibacteriota bacterium]
MKQFFSLVLTVIAAVVFSYLTSFAQHQGGTKIIRQAGGPGGIQGQPFNMGELGAVIAKDSSGIHVLFIGPSESRPKAYQSVDLQAQDEILMMNGKKLTSIEDLEKGYEAAAIGSTLQFGVKRGGQLMVVSFPKADPKDLPKRQMMIMNDDGKGGKNFKMNGKDLKMAPGIDEVDHIPGLGVLVGVKDKKVVIAAVMPFAMEDPNLKSLASGDEVLSVGGKPVASTSQVISAYQETKVGDKFSFKVMHGGKETEVSVTKQEDTGVRIIRKN